MEYEKTSAITPPHHHHHAFRRGGSGAHPGDHDDMSRNNSAQQSGDDKSAPPRRHTSANIPHHPRHSFRRRGPGDHDGMSHSNSAQQSGDDQSAPPRRQFLSTVCHSIHSLTTSVGSNGSLMSTQSGKCGRNAAAKEIVDGLFAKYCGWPAMGAGIDSSSSAGAASRACRAEDRLMSLEGFCAFRQKHERGHASRRTENGGGSTSQCADCGGVFDFQKCLTGMPIRIFNEYYAAYQWKMKSGDCELDTDYSKVVHISLSCKELPSMDMIGESDPFALVSYRLRGSAGEWKGGAKSEPQKDNPNPTFELLSFSMDGADATSLETAEILVEVFDKDFFREEKIGWFKGTLTALACLEKSSGSEPLVDARSESWFSKTAAWRGKRRTKRIEAPVGYIRVNEFQTSPVVSLSNDNLRSPI